MAGASSFVGGELLFLLYHEEGDCGVLKWGYFFWARVLTGCKRY
jgi:hypothetical protein